MKPDGERLKEIIDNADITQIKFAELLGTHPQTVSRWVNSTYLSTEVIRKACDALNKEVWEFFIDEAALADKYDIPEEYVLLIQKLMETPEEFRIKMLTMITEFTEMWLEKK